MIRVSKQNFFDQRLNSAEEKTFWKTVKLLNQNHSSIPTLQFNGTVAETAVGKANALNSFFFNCFNHQLNPLSCSNPEFSHSTLDPVHCPEELLCTEEITYDLLCNLDVSKSVGCDGISAKMMKSTACSIAPILTRLFNKSICTGELPATWKHGRIVPVPKNPKDKNQPSGYRPISILPIVSKVIERHVKVLIEDHLERNAPISPRQWGFVSSRSTVSALIRVVDDWSRALDQGLEVCVVFFDISKAFDTVPHLLLLQKFNELGINPYLLRWLRSYLINRSQFVAVDGSDSQTLPVISGVPQGSVLGPLMFICYINDVASVVSPGSDISLFADDIALYRIIRSSSDYLELQTDIDSITTCIESKYLKFNASKCKYMLVSRRRLSPSTPTPLNINGCVLTKVTSYKYLGVTITSNLSWSPHIDNICSKARRLVGMLYRHFYTNSSPQTLLKLYLSFIRPRLEYSSAVWNPHLKKDIEAIENVQKFAVRVCLKSFDMDYADLLRNAAVSPLQLRRQQACLCHLYKIVHGITDYPESPLQHAKPHYCTRSLNSQALAVPQFRTLSHQHSFFPSTITMWNELPSYVYVFEDSTSDSNFNNFKSNIIDYISTLF